jgi:hypothetical protein
MHLFATTTAERVLDLGTQAAVAEAGPALVGTASGVGWTPSA